MNSVRCEFSTNGEHQLSKGLAFVQDDGSLEIRFTCMNGQCLLETMVSVDADELARQKAEKDDT